MAIKVNYRQLTKAGLVAILYGFLSAIAVNDFLNVVNSYSTGLLGLSQLIHAVVPNLSMSLLMTVLNVPLFIFAWRVFGFRYILFSGIAVLSNIIFLGIVPTMVLVKDPLTNTIIGSALIGLSIGWCFNNGFTTGGMDIVATYCQRRFHKNVGFFANVINGLIVVLTLIFFGPGRIVYTLIGMLIVNALMDYAFASQTDVMVIIFTKRAAKLIQQLRRFTHGATILNGKGAYTGKPTDVIMVVTPRGQLAFLRDLIKSEDPNAFMSIQKSDVESGKYTHYSL
ncbi:YitT family protein [Limosilactobacillus oris]|uniref:YitT family protein n=1 Tax=Limosilactobacillus oris TaxID=1632 RepID=UPI0018846308|nr:YitT family protein [Limosilactobacillus oris]MBF0601421.1 YitT family protein [Limosilactobacillus oris]